MWEEAEIAFLMAVRHERLVECIGAGKFEHAPLHSDRRFSGSGMFCVLEFMSGGAITDRLWDERTLVGTHFDSVLWLERITWASDAAAGMMHIHSSGYTHRDLKSVSPSPTFVVAEFVAYPR